MRRSLLPVVSWWAMGWTVKWAFLEGVENLPWRAGVGEIEAAWFADLLVVLGKAGDDVFDVVADGVVVVDECGPVHGGFSFECGFGDAER